MPNETFSARVYVTDLAEARQFFSSVLNLPLEDDGTADGYLVFTAAGGKSLLVERADTTSIHELSDMMDATEMKIADMEARAAAIADLSRDRLDEKIQQRERDTKVESDLAALKQQAIDAKEGVKKVRLVVDHERKFLPAVRPRKDENLPKRLED
jgi:hypothetical protein